MLRKTNTGCIGSLHYLAEKVHVPSVPYITFQRMVWVTFTNLLCPKWRWVDCTFRTPQPKCNIM